MGNLRQLVNFSIIVCFYSIFCLMGLATFTRIGLAAKLQQLFIPKPESRQCGAESGSTAVCGVEAASKADVPAVWIPQVCTVPSMGRRWSCAAVGLTQGWGQCVMVSCWTPGCVLGLGCVAQVSGVGSCAVCMGSRDSLPSCPCLCCCWLKPSICLHLGEGREKARINRCCPKV